MLFRHKCQMNTVLLPWQQPTCLAEEAAQWRQRPCRKHSRRPACCECRSSQPTSPAPTRHQRSLQCPPLLRWRHRWWRLARWLRGCCLQGIRRLHTRRLIPPDPGLVGPSREPSSGYRGRLALSSTCPWSSARSEPPSPGTSPPTACQCGQQPAPSVTRSPAAPAAQPSLTTQPVTSRTAARSPARQSARRATGSVWGSPARTEPTCSPAPSRCRCPAWAPGGTGGSRRTSSGFPRAFPSGGRPSRPDTSVQPRSANTSTLASHPGSSDKSHSTQPIRAGCRGQGSANRTPRHPAASLWDEARSRWESTTSGRVWPVTLPRRLCARSSTLGGACCLVATSDEWCLCQMLEQWASDSERKCCQ